MRRATIIKLIPPAKSVSLSSWKIAAIKKKISWIVNIVIPVNFEDEEIRNVANLSIVISLAIQGPVARTLALPKALNFIPGVSLVYTHRAIPYFL